MSKILIDEATVKLALEALVAMSPSGPTGSLIWHQQMYAITALREALAQQALDKKADNARELGLDYEPVWGSGFTNKDYEDAMRQRRLHQLTSPPAQQEPVAWTPINQPYPPGGELDILMGDGSILCEVLPQADGDLWWGGASTGERFIDPKYASVTHWRIHAEHTSPPPPQRKESK